MRDPLPYPQVAVYYCYEVTAMLVSGIYLAAYLYAYSHDPWLTPRHTPYMILWWKIGCHVRSLLLACSRGYCDIGHVV
jgi:hypothetical protein